MPSHRQEMGERGERLAEEWLMRRGWETLAQNYRCPHGEIDLIMREDATLVFVEVKTRRSLMLGYPAEAVTPFKQRQITRTAQHYLDELETSECACRFDVVEVLLLDGSAPQFNLIPGAFEVAGE